MLNPDILIKIKKSKDKYEIRDSKQPAGCFSLRWTQECNIRGGTERNGNGTERNRTLTIIYIDV